MFNSLKKTVTSAALMLGLLLGSGIILGTTAEAAQRDDRRWGRNDRGRNGDSRNQRGRGWGWGRDRDRYGDHDRDRYGNGRYDDRYGRFGGLTQTGRRVAEERGYRTGVDRGREDASRRRDFNPSRHSTYRDGDSGHRSEFGNKDAYRAVYRDAYRDGYEQGYRQVARYYGRR